ncbi:hypothetical protein Syun_009859 [Stephania yunnanensis]|uniref:Uncharacterized protein n=1 Tax=Stephania yunnanensis TaxID=152371 RepID=A0AAP0KGE2_9MAGN
MTRVQGRWSPKRGKRNEFEVFENEMGGRLSKEKITESSCGATTMPPSPKPRHNRTGF